MRNLKKLLAVVMVVAMIASIMVPAFAAESFQKEAEMLKDLGLFKGYSDTEFGLGDDLNREQALVFMLRVMGLEDEALAMSKDEVAQEMARVVDPETVSEWARPYVAYAIKNGLTKGRDAKIYPNIKFDGQATVTGKEFITFMLYGMGYKDPNWDEILNIAAEIGMLKAGEAVTFGSIAAMKRDEAVGVMSKALNGLTSEGITLAQALVDAGVVDEEKMVEYGYITPTVAPTEAPEEIEVVSVIADNLKEIVLVFNRALDKDTVKVDNIKVKKNGVTVSDYTVSLKDDQQTVVIKAKDANSFENQTKYDVTLKGIKDADKVAMKETTLEVVPFDKELPEVVDIKVTGPKSMEIEFSEPIKAAGTITLKTGTTTVGVNSSSISGLNTNVIKFNLYSNLTDGKTYTINIKGFKDFADYQMINFTGDIDYVADKSEIVATVEKAEQTYVVIKFNKPVSGIRKEFFYHTFSAWQPVNVFSNEDMTEEVSGAVDKVWVQFYDGEDGYPIPEGDVKLVIRDKVGDDKIKDNWGNEFLGAELIITVGADKTPPSVVELKVDTERALKIKFDEEVKFSADNVEVLNADGSKISDIKITVTGSGKEYTIDLGKSYSGKSILVNIKNVEDKALSPNKMALYSEVLDITDHTKPSVNKVTYKEVTGEKALFVFFSESVNDTALNKDNYYLVDANGVWAKFSNAPEFYDGDKVVRIELKDEELAKIKVSGAKVVVRDVEDLAGNKMLIDIKDSILEYDAEANRPKIEKAEATATNKVVLTFDQYLTDVDAAAFEVNGEAPIGMEVSTNDKGNTVITLTAHDDHKFAYDLSGSPKVEVVDGELLKNIFGVTVAEVEITNIADKIRPEIKKDGIWTLDTNNDGKIDNIQVNFTEKVKFNYIAATTFTVEGYTVLDAYATTVANAVYDGRGPETNVADSDIVIIRVKQKDEADSTAKPKVKVVTEVQDLAGNKYDLEKDAIASVDKTVPFVVTKLQASGAISEDKKLTLEFSEALDEASRNAVVQAVEAAITKTGDAVVKFTWSGNKTLTVDIQLKGGTVTLGSVDNVTVKDVAGNEAENLDIQEE